MTITSYAQNFEDVMLWRALSTVESGYYIDIGAQDPVNDSVSLYFYERGWRGLHVEPVPHYAELLRQSRPEDIVLQAAVGCDAATLRFFEFPDTGISTAIPTIADQHKERGFAVNEIVVPCISLQSVFDAVGGREVHWLKIDVEGFEKSVLSSWGDSLCRPWIVVVESTMPLTRIEVHEQWEYLLAELGYKPVYFDGLNRFYVSGAHPQLAKHFAAPPNVFDDFSLNGTASAPFTRLMEQRHKNEVAHLENAFAERVAAAEAAASAVREQTAANIAAAEGRVVAADERVVVLEGRIAEDEERRKQDHAVAQQEAESLRGIILNKDAELSGLHATLVSLHKTLEVLHQTLETELREHNVRERHYQQRIRDAEQNLSDLRGHFLTRAHEDALREQSLAGRIERGKIELDKAKSTMKAIQDVLNERLAAERAQTHAAHLDRDAIRDELEAIRSSLWWRLTHRFVRPRGREHRAGTNGEIAEPR